MAEKGGMLHGVAGYFESVLYKDVILSKVFYIFFLFVLRVILDLAALKGKEF